MTVDTRFIINGGGVKLNGGLQRFWKIIKQGERVKINGGVGTKYSREETKLGLSFKRS